MGEDLPAGLAVHIVNALGVDGHHDALGTEALGRFTYQFRVVDGGGVDADLVGTGVEHGADVVHGADAAADGEGDKYVFCDLLHCVYGGVAALVAGGNIEEGDLVGALLVVAHGDFYRVAGIADADKIDAFYNAAVVHVEAGDDALGQAHSVSSRLPRRTAVALRRRPGCLRRWRGR